MNEARNFFIVGLLRGTEECVMPRGMRTSRKSGTGFRIKGIAEKMMVSYSVGADPEKFRMHAGSFPARHQGKEHGT
jgi:hypothetical protein